MSLNPSTIYITVVWHVTLYSSWRQRQQVCPKYQTIIIHWKWIMCILKITIIYQWNIDIMRTCNFLRTHTQLSGFLKVQFYYVYCRRLPEAVEQKPSSSSSHIIHILKTGTASKGDLCTPNFQVPSCTTFNPFITLTCFKVGWSDHCASSSLTLAVKATRIGKHCFTSSTKPSL